MPFRSSSLVNNTPTTFVAYLVGSFGGAFKFNKSVPLYTLNEDRKNKNSS